MPMSLGRDVPSIKSNQHLSSTVLTFNVELNTKNKDARRVRVSWRPHQTRAGINRFPNSNPSPGQIPLFWPHHSSFKMARADKSALVKKAVSAIKRGEFRDYSKAAARYGCDRTAVSKRIRGLTKTVRPDRRPTPSSASASQTPRKRF
jgi:hypothetical protein